MKHHYHHVSSIRVYFVVNEGDIDINCWFLVVSPTLVNRRVTNHTVVDHCEVDNRKGV